MKWTFVLFHPELSSGEIAGWIKAANRKTSVVTRHGRQVGQVHPGGYRSQPSSHLSRVSDNWQFLDQTGLQAEDQRMVSGGSLEPGLGVPSSYLALGHWRLSGVDTVPQAFVGFGAHPGVDAGAHTTLASHGDPTQLGHHSLVMY